MNLAATAEISLVHRHGRAYGALLKGQQATGTTPAASAPAGSAAATRAGIRAAAKEFESIFVYQMISAMRKTIGDGGFIKKSNGQEIFEGMLDEEWGRKLAAKSGPRGLSEILYQQLSRQLGLDEEGAGSGQVPTAIADQVRQLTDQMRKAAGAEALNAAMEMGGGAAMPLLDLRTTNYAPALMLGRKR